MFLKFTILLVFLSSASLAQQLIGRDLKDNLFIKISKPGEQNFDNIEGSPYLNEAFVAGEIIAFNTKFDGVPMRYNIFNDNIEFKQNNSQYIILPEPRVQQVQIGSNIFIAEKHEVAGKPKLGFLSLLDSGKIVLMAKKMIIYSPKSEPNALNPVSTPARFTRDQDRYFYKVGNGETKKISNLKNLIKSLPDKQDEVTEFAKKEKISIKNQDDLLKLVRYYNSLK